MGAWFDSIHVKTEDSDKVQKVLEQLSRKADCKFLLGLAINGWISIFPNELGRNESVSTAIAELIPHDMFQLMVHDDDVFQYYFYRGGQLIDRYVSCPDYFEEMPEDERQQCEGHPELFQDLFADSKSLNKLQKLLVADKFTFESERMTQFVELLGLQNTLSSYEYLQGGEHDEVEGWEKFVHIESQPVSAEDYNNRGEAKLTKDDLDGALADFNKALEFNPDYAVAHENRNRVELAKVDRNKTVADTWQNFGRIKEGEGDLHSALVAYNKAIELNPNAVAYNNRGLIKKRKNDFDGAMTDFNKAIELEPSLMAAYVNRGDIKRAKNDFNGALDDYGKAIELKPDSAAAYNNRGELRRGKKDLDGALQDYNKAIELIPDSPIYFCNRGLAKLSKRDLEGAFADCNKAIELKSDFAVAYNNRGMVKQVKGDLDGALEDYDRAISLKSLAAFHTNRDMAQQIKNKKSEA